MSKQSRHRGALADPWDAGLVTLFYSFRFQAGTLFTPACNCSENMALGLAYLFYEPKRNDTRYGRSEKDQVYA